MKSTGHFCLPLSVEGGGGDGDVGFLTGYMVDELNNCFSGWPRAAQRHERRPDEWRIGHRTHRLRAHCSY